MLGAILPFVIVTYYDYKVIYPRAYASPTPPRSPAEGFHVAVLRAAVVGLVAANLIGVVFGIIGLFRLRRLPTAQRSEMLQRSIAGILFNGLIVLFFYSCYVAAPYIR